MTLTFDRLTPLLESKKNVRLGSYEKGAMNYTDWSELELRRAESVSATFLEQNRDAIRESFQLKVHELDDLVKSLGSPLPLDERLNRFAQIADVARALEEDARGFFCLASEPLVARILAHVAGKPR